MSIRKKILISAAIFFGIILISGGIFAVAMLNRVKYVSIEEAEEIAVKEEQEYQDAVESGEIEEELAVLVSGELDLNEEIQQTQLSADELAAIEERQKLADVTNILLIGVDRRDDASQSRSDTILIATLDKANGRLKLTSLMRDLYVPIARRGENRINSACNNGGPGLLMETINQNFKMDIEKYVMIDFRMFQSAVDLLGGITMNMSKGEVSEANDCIAGLNKQWKQPVREGFITQKEGGDVTLTGVQALGYARMRHFGNGDYSRTSRQFKVIEEIYKKYVASSITSQTKILYDLLPMVETNLETPEIIALATAALSIENQDLMHYRLPVEGKYKQKTVRGMWVLLPDIAANTKLLHWFIYEATQVDPLEGSDTQAGNYHTIKEPKKKAVRTASPQTPPPVADNSANNIDAVIPDERSGDQQIPSVPNESSNDTGNNGAKDVQTIPETNDSGDINIPEE